MIDPECIHPCCTSRPEFARSSEERVEYGPDDWVSYCRTFQVGPSCRFPCADCKAINVAIGRPVPKRPAPLPAETKDKT